MATEEPRYPLAALAAELSAPVKWLRGASGPRITRHEALCLIAQNEHLIEPTTGPGPAALTDALQQLSTLLRLTVEAADNIAAMLTGQPVSTAADTYPDSGPDTRGDDERPRLSVVRPLSPDTTEDSE